MYLSLTDILKIITIFQIFLISTFLFFNSTRKSVKNLLLTAFILSKAFFLADSLFISHYREIIELHPDIILIGSSFQFILGPALYFIIIEITHGNIVFKSKHLLHLLPFILHLGFMTWNYHFYNDSIKLNLLENGFPYNTSWFRSSATINYLQFTAYGLYSLFILSKTKKEVYKTSSQQVDKKIGFLRFLIIDFIVFWGTNTILMYIPGTGSFRAVLSPLTILNIFFIANAIVYQGLKFPQLFLDENIKKQKYEKNLLSEEEKEYYAFKLKEYMKTNKPYLDPGLSLADLADRVIIPPYVLSQILNVVFKQNFYDFVNNYRVEESKRLLKESEETSKTILEVLYNSGFNSKSVFNSAFRKNTGMTPSEFRRFS